MLEQLGDGQRGHWERAYAEHPGMYGGEPSGDAHYGAGTGHGDDIWEHGGFAVHFFSRALVDDLAADGWRLAEVHPFEEGALPRRLWRVTQVRV